MTCSERRPLSAEPCTARMHARTPHAYTHASLGTTPGAWAILWPATDRLQSASHRPSGHACMAEWDGTTRGAASPVPFPHEGRDKAGPGRGAGGGGLVRGGALPSALPSAPVRASQGRTHAQAVRLALWLSGVSGPCAPRHHRLAVLVAPSP